MTTPHLVGRESEQRLIGNLLDSVRSRGATLVIRGETGIGKSSLLDFATARARGRGVQILTTAGSEAETNLPFAGLHQLLRSVVERAAQLPAPQEAALQAAFGILDGTTPNPFLIALATLSLLSDVAAEAPLVLIVEDAQWLDRPTINVLIFVARRLESDPIVLLLAIRDGTEHPLMNIALPELRLAELDEQAANALLDAHAPELAPTVRERLLRNAMGNPLALIELSLALRTAGVVGETLTSRELPLTTRLEQMFAARLAALPKETRTLLLIAAADEAGELSHIMRAATALISRPSTLDMVDPAVSARLLEVSGEAIRFRHPLMRSAIYQSASLAERQSAHASLAAVLASDPDRRAWHLAASITGTDDDVAKQLAAAAERALQRGATATAVSTLEAAARLSANSAQKGAYLLQAIEGAFELGQHGDVVRLLRQVEKIELRPMDVPRLAWMREVIEEGAWSGASWLDVFADIAEQMRLVGDYDNALRALQSVALRSFWSNPTQETQDRIVRIAEQIPISENDPRLVYILALVSPVQRGRVVVERLSRLGREISGNIEAAHLLGVAASAVGAFDLASDFYQSAIADMRAQGHLGSLAQTLVHLAWCEIHLGDLARRTAVEAVKFTQETEQPLWLLTAQLAEAALAAYRSDSTTAYTLLEAAEGVLLPKGATPMLALVQFARGVASLASGQYEDAFIALRRIYDPSDTAYHPHLRSWVLASFVEAAVHSGHADDARSVVQECEALVVETHATILQVSLSYARPLLADDSESDKLFQAGLQADLKRWPFHRARLLLAYGVWLRRQRRVSESRVPLVAARDSFDALGAVSWGERARTELRASGITSRPRTIAMSDMLSPQELQIAQLAAEGMSNREIGYQLYLSPRTVASHLYRVFPKLGITSRHQLSNKFGA